MQLNDALFQQVSYEFFVILQDAYCKPDAIQSASCPDANP